MNNGTLLWTVLLAAFGLCGWWHARENAQLARTWRKTLDAKSAAWLIHFAWSRTIQLLIVFAACLLIIVSYDWQLRAAHNETQATLQARVEAPAPAAALAAPAPAATATPSPAPAQNTTPAKTEYYPPIVPVPSSAQPGIVPAQPAAAPAAATPSAEDTGESVEDVYNPEKTGGDNQSAMDDIKKRYEEILVTYMFLKKCGKVNASDYPLITSALAREMASVNAPGRLQYDILTSAQGSYKEMYSKSSCDGAGMDALYTQYTDYIKGLSENPEIQ